MKRFGNPNCRTTYFRTTHSASRCKTSHALTPNPKPCGLGFRVYTNCIGFRSGVLSDFWPTFDGVSVLTFALYNVYLPGLEGLGSRV